MFPGRDGGTFSGFSNAKKSFDAACGVNGWRLHDLRVTGRTLLARAGVKHHVGEMCLGHGIKGIEGVYNKHKHKHIDSALTDLANLIDRIVNPVENVVALRG